ncbi:uncharacterized protein [Triticum aestivum]|nr:uncharacterized protein LOC123068751 isoform X6 [Triticum aestivum]XP_044347328.1 uncharacterized protein LOC123068751 isoform X6 [Triticum aestivum]
MMEVNHQNIVRFIGFCSNTEHKRIQHGVPGGYIYAEARERILCFEYISNGSLDKYITDELRGLEWDTRYNIIKGICDGLEYLHMKKHIIHMDLKPANVLLDNHMVAKITDFGLARMDGNSHTTNQVFTLGYCAPEYLLGGRMSVKSDVYSLGVIIIELVMGRRGTPDINNVLRRWRHRWGKSANGTPFRYQQIAKLVEIGLCCQEDDLYKRPFISEIIRDIKELESTDREISNTNESGKISPYWEDDMLGVKPLELRFPFVLNKEISCTLEVTNGTNSYIAFNIETMSPLPYCIKANKVIVPPQSKCSVNITLQPLDKVPEGKQYSDNFIIRSTKVSECLTSEDITEDMFNLEEGKVVDEVTLTVVHDEPFEPHVDLPLESLTISGTKNLNSTEKSNVPSAETESTISSSFSNGLIRFDPPELCFPLLSNKTVLSSVKIVNITDCYVGFNTYFLERNVALYTTSYGIVPPRSTQVLTVRGNLREDALIDMQFNDKYFVWNGIMAEDVRHDIDLSDYMDSEESEELPIVLTEMTPCTSNDLIQFDPPELRIPCWPNKASMAWLNIENITDYYVGFIASLLTLETTSSLTRNVVPRSGRGILPPRSTQRILIKRVAKKKETEIEDMKWENKFFVWNMIVAEGVAADNLIPFITEEVPKELPINLQKISPCASDELIRFDPPELCFPFLPNKTSLSSVNMVNMTDYSIYFKNYVWKKNKAWYDTEPRNGIVPPRSTQRLVVKRETMENELEDSESKDKCFLHNFILTQDVKASDLLLLNEEGTELPIDNLCDCVVENKDGTEFPVYHSRTCHVANEEITELPIVLAKINPSTSNELIQIVPPELCFPFSPKKNLLSLIKIVNITDYYIGFNTFGKENNAALYNTEPPCGILSPQSTQELVVTRIQKGDALEETQCKDKYIVWSSFVNEGVNTVDLKGCTSEKESKELPIVFMETNSNELIQFDPPELFLPLVPNKSVLSSVNIVNRTDHFIGFSICTKKSNSAKYFTNPSEGILPPRSTQLLMVTSITEEKELTDMHCKDKYMVWNGIVSEDVNDVIDSMSEIKITELPIVLTETSSPASYELIHFDPPELFFPILPNKKVLSSIKIVNITDYNVGFNTYSRPTNAAWCHTEPARGILPPQSTQKLMVTRERKEEASEHMQVNDKYFVWNSIVTEGVKDSDLGDYMVEKESKELPIVLSKISSLTSNELIQFDPAELHFPFSPQEIFPFTFDIINITDFNVAFTVYSVVKNAARRKESFMEGILPPRSTRESTMVWQLKEMGPGGKEYELEDKIFFWSRLVTEGVEARDIIGYMSEEESKELPIFFHKESSPCASNELIQFDPPELNFHVLPNKVCVFSVNVVNSTDYYVAFSTGLPNSKVAWYVKPSERIMPPKTTQRLVLKRTAKEKELGDMQCQDKLFLCNRIVSEDAEPSDIIGDMDGDLTTFSKELRIVLHMHYFPFFSQTNLCTSDELIQFDPPQLRYPFFPNKKAPMVCLLKIVNVTDYCVGFHILAHHGNSASYTANTPVGILPPRSTQEIRVKRISKERESGDMLCKDMVSAWNGIVTESIKVSDINHFNDLAESKELPIVFTKPGESSSM